MTKGASKSAPAGESARPGAEPESAHVKTAAAKSPAPELSGGHDAPPPAETASDVVEAEAGALRLAQAMAAKREAGQEDTAPLISPTIDPLAQSHDDYTDTVAGEDAGRKLPLAKVLGDVTGEVEVRVTLPEKSQSSLKTPEPKENVRIESEGDTLVVRGDAASAREVLDNLRLEIGDFSGGALTLAIDISHAQGSTSKQLVLFRSPHHDSGFESTLALDSGYTTGGGFNPLDVPGGLDLSLGEVFSTQASRLVIAQLDRMVAPIGGDEGSDAEAFPNFSMRGVETRSPELEGFFVTTGSDAEAQAMITAPEATIIVPVAAPVATPWGGGGGGGFTNTVGPTVSGNGLVDMMVQSSALQDALIVDVSAGFDDVDLPQGDTLTYSITENYVYGTGDPSTWTAADFLQIDADTGELTLSRDLLNGDEGAVYLTIQAEDSGGLTTTESFELFVADPSVNTTGVFNPGPGATLGGDSINGAASTNEWFWSDAGDDDIHGQHRNDTIHAGDGNDGINGSAHGHTVYGGQGNDTIGAAGGPDWIYGGDGNDSIWGGNLAAADRLYGGSGADTITTAHSAGGGNIIMNGQSGSDILRSTDSQYLTSTDTLLGGTGADTLQITNANTNALTADFEDGAWEHVSGIETFDLDADAAHNLTFHDDYLTRGTGIEGNTITVDASTLTTGITADGSGMTDSNYNLHVTGGSGDDTVYASAGVDNIIGGAGNENIYFTTGNFSTDDTVNGGSNTAEDYLRISSNSSGDYSYDTANYTSITNIERLYFSGADSYTITARDSFHAQNNASMVFLFNSINDSVIFDASNLTGVNSVEVIENSNADASLTGSLNNDRFRFFGSRLNGDDTIAGGAGSDSIEIISNALTLTVADTQNISGIERIVLDVDAAHAIAIDDGFFDRGTEVEGDIFTITTTATTAGITVDGRAISDSTHELSVTGGDAADTIYGGAGADTLQGSSGTETGNNVIWGYGGDDEITTSEGNDTIYAGDGDDSVVAGVNVVIPQDFNLIYGGAGNDTLFGGRNHDTIYGEEGEDSIGGYLGNDLIYGGESNDSIDGWSNDDTLYGGEGQDTLDGRGNNDALFGGEAGDSLVGFNGDDSLSGDAGDDTLAGGRDSDTLHGGAGNDTMQGGAVESDTLIGGYGADTIRGGAPGADGDGTNVFLYNDPNESTTTETDIIKDLDDDGADADKLLFYGFDTLVTTVPGAQNELRWQNAVGDLTGNGEDDILLTGANNFRLILEGAGAGADNITLADGGGSQNVFFEDDARSELGLGAISGSYITGTSGDDNGGSSLTGTANADYILGLEGADSIDGATDHDTIYGGEGDDTVFAGLGTDIVYGAAGDDNIDGGNGDGSSDTIYGGAGNDTIDGGDGADEIYGGTGDDSIIGGGSTDLIYGGEGNDYLYDNGGGTSFDTIYGGNGNDTIELLGAGGDLVYAGSGGDSIDAGDGDDTLYGDSGNDTIDAGDGDDEIFGGSGADRFEWTDITHSATGAGNRDIITDFSGNGGEGDQIDLSAIDTFTFAGEITAAQSGDNFTADDEVRFYQDAGNNRTIIQVNEDGDQSTVDMEIELTGLHTLTAGDFIF